MKSLLPLLGSLAFCFGNVADAQQHDKNLRHIQETTKCTIDGVTYQAGDSLGDSFSTRCGDASIWPCYCSPGLDPPVECPYCGIPDLDQGLVCARDGETISIVNLDGSPQRCSCNVGNTGSPQETCVDQTGGDADFCTIELFDGSQMEFQNGESFGQFLPTRCKGGGEEYPCFCNTTLPDRVECPYCKFVDVNEDLICARADETIVYEESLGDFLQCTCFDGTFSSCIPVAPTAPAARTSSPTMSPTISSDELTASPTIWSSPLQSATPTSGTSQPSSSTASSTPFPGTPLPPNLGPILGPPSTESPSFSTVEETIQPSSSTEAVPSSAPTSTSSSVLEPTISPTAYAPAVFDKEGLIGAARSPMAEPQIGGCLYTNVAKKAIEFVEEGATFGERVSGPCSPDWEWPVYCNPNIPGGGLEYPYCVFSTTVVAGTSGSDEVGSGIVCARSEERVLVSKPDGTTEECSCLYFNPLLGPVSSCPLLAVDLSSPVPTQAPSTADATPTPTGVDGDGDGEGGGTDPPPTPGGAPALPPPAGSDNEEDGSAAASVTLTFINYGLAVAMSLLFSKTTIL